jgi:hypothetical protein
MMLATGSLRMVSSFIVSFGFFFLLRVVSDEIIAPAESAIAYTLVKFGLGFQAQLEIYEQPPSAQVDEAWEDLTRCKQVTAM